MANLDKHRRRGLKWVMAGLITALGLGSFTPAEAGPVEGTFQYGKDRVNDFVDIFRLRVGVPRSGRGYGAKARVTSALQAGFVHYNGHYLGLEKRGVGIVRERRTEGGVSLLYGSTNQMQPLWGNEYLEGTTPWTDLKDRKIIRNLPSWDDGRSRLFSLGAEVATPIIAVDAGVYPEEALDFVLGFVLLDIYRDDELFLEQRDVQGQFVPTTPPGPDMDAATRRKQQELDALYGESLRQRMLEEGQLTDEALEGFSAAAQERLRRRYEQENTQPRPARAAEPAMWSLEEAAEEAEVSAEQLEQAVSEPIVTEEAPQGETQEP